MLMDGRSGGFQFVDDEAASSAEISLSRKVTELADHLLVIVHVQGLPAPWWRSFW